ncbi:hypothetical protein WR25_23349 [Diploscapter pachys]|uniref:Uncharacterized protein n=1 Tax=Diploscapter pachys TaxID=2018661 RepID=A0A2A2K233_9BILA|nr:hypothetical protein WR25_23349 [Diploscapter pachys]
MSTSMPMSSNYTPVLKYSRPPPQPPEEPPPPPHPGMSPMKLGRDTMFKPPPPPPPQPEEPPPQPEIDDENFIDQGHLKTARRAYATKKCTSIEQDKKDCFMFAFSYSDYKFWFHDVIGFQYSDPRTTGKRPELFMNPGTDS